MVNNCQRETERENERKRRKREKEREERERERKKRREEKESRERRCLSNHTAEVLPAAEVLHQHARMLIASIMSETMSASDSGIKPL